MTDESRRAGKAADHSARVNKYLKRFYDEINRSLPEDQKVEFQLLDDEGYTAIQKGSATVGINVLEDHRILMFLSVIMKVPETRQLELFRKLLELNFLATSDAAFAIDRRNNHIYVRALRGLEGLDYEEFRDMLETVAEVADQFDDRLREEFAN
jgi:hypothetical protein